MQLAMQHKGYPKIIRVINRYYKLRIMQFSGSHLCLISASTEFNIAKESGRKFKDRRIKMLIIFITHEMTPCVVISVDPECGILYFNINMYRLIWYRHEIKLH
jgi:hypothetical protein